MSTVKMGVVALSMPARALDTPFSTSLAVNKNAGMALPKKPTPNMGSNFLRGTFLKK